MDAPSSRGPRLRTRRTVKDADADDDRIVAALYREYHRPLLSFVAKLVGNDRQWAEDVVQETMIRAWRNADLLDSESTSLMPWLATVARRIVIDDRRRKAARPPEAGEDGLDAVRIGDGLEDLLRKVVVTEALKSLSPAHREVAVAKDGTRHTVTEWRVSPQASSVEVHGGTAISRSDIARFEVAVEGRGRPLLSVPV